MTCAGTPGEPMWQLPGGLSRRATPSRPGAAAFDVDERRTTSLGIQGAGRGEPVEAAGWSGLRSWFP